MELGEAIRGNATCRHYKPDPVPDDVVARVLSAARYAPSGGNRQPLRLVAVRDAGKRRQLADWYLPHWESYIAQYGGSGGTAGPQRLDAAPAIVRDADHFARHLAEVPLLVVVCARLADVHPTDAELGRLSVVGGASIYPAVENLLLSAREQGLGAALTTLLCFEEPKVKALLDIPDDISTVATVALGYPDRPLPTRLRRRPLASIAFLDRYGQTLPASDDT